MSRTLDLAHLSSSDFDALIAALTADIDSLRGKLKNKEERLAWAMKGRELFTSNGAGVSTLTTPPSASMPRPAPSNGTPPSLRIAILRVFLERPAGAYEPRWSAAEVITELERRGWMPNSESWGPATVRGKLRDLAKQGQLEQLGRGTFALPAGAREHPDQFLADAMTGSPGSMQALVIDAVTALQHPATPSEIAAFIRPRKADVNKGSVHNALARLTEKGTLTRRAGGRYQLAPRNGSSPEPNSGATKNGARGTLFAGAAAPGGA